jgi:hypothetical protein
LQSYLISWGGHSCLVLLNQNWFVQSVDTARHPYILLSCFHAFVLIFRCLELCTYQITIPWVSSESDFIYVFVLFVKFKINGA